MDRWQTNEIARLSKQINEIQQITDTIVLSNPQNGHFITYNDGKLVNTSITLAKAFGEHRELENPGTINCVKSTKYLKYTTSAVTYNLPTFPTIGVWDEIIFINGTSTGDMVIQASSNSRFVIPGDGTTNLNATLTSTAPGFLHLMCINVAGSVHWIVLYSSGTWVSSG